MAANTLSTTLKFTLKGVFKKKFGDTQIAKNEFVKTLDDVLSDGTGSDEANKYYHTRSSLSGAEVIDVADLLDDFGDSIDFRELKAVLIFNNSTTLGEILTLGGGSNHIHVPVGEIGPGGIYFAWNPKSGYRVDGSRYKLKLDAGSNTIVYDLILVGAEYSTTSSSSSASSEGI